MIVDIDPFLMMGINMVYFSGDEKGKGKNKYLWVPKLEAPQEKKQSVFNRLEALTEG